MPNTTAGAIVVDTLEKPTKILLTKRNIPPFKNQWCFPGGHIDTFEKGEDAVVREVKEETGLDFTPHFLHYFDEIYRERSVHNVVLMFYGTATGEINIQEEEVADIAWFSLGEAAKLDLAFGHNEVLEHFAELKGI